MIKQNMIKNQRIFKNGGFADKIRQIADKVGQYAYNIGGQIRQNGIVGKIERRKPPLSASKQLGCKKINGFKPFY